MNQNQNQTCLKTKKRDAAKKEQEQSRKQLVEREGGGFCDELDESDQ